MEKAEAVLAFWFAPDARAKWFVKDAGFDALVRERLADLAHAAADGRLDGWKMSARGALALVVLLDQVPRNIYRGDPRSYACDEAARRVTLDALAANFDRELGQVERFVLYLPLEHSENLAEQELCCDLMAKLDEEKRWHEYALKHRDIVARFGRFPHRNAVLGRANTPEEDAFLKEEGSSF